MEKQHESIGLEIRFLHAGSEIKGVVTHYKPEGPSSIYLYRAIDTSGIRYLITKENLIELVKK